MTTNSLAARSNEYSDQRSGVGDFVSGQRMRDFAKRGRSSTLKFFLVVILKDDYHASFKIFEIVQFKTEFQLLSVLLSLLHFTITNF